MKGVVLIAASAIALAVAAILGPAAFAGGEPKMGGGTVTRADLKGVNFIESCRYSHQAPDDPIVYPGQPGLSHQHTFAGNTSTNAFSSFGSLRSSPTTCMKRADTAAYWVPALYQGTTEILPTGATIYYRRGTTASVQTFPNNLRMIAGDSKATTAQDLRITYWNCGVEAGVPASSTVPTCPDSRGSFLRLHIRFPECWDGRNLDSADHKSHMAYAMKGTCPATPPDLGPAGHRDLPLPDGRRRGLLPLLGRPVQRARRLPERLEPGRLEEARERLPERARALREGLELALRPRRERAAPRPALRLARPSRRGGTRATP